MIKDLKILIHGIPYAMTFIVIQSSVLVSSYSMLLGRLWIRDVKVFHDWGKNTIITQGIGTVKTIDVTKKLGAPTKHLEVRHKGGFDVCHKTMIVFNRNHNCSYTNLVKSTFKLITSISLNSVEHIIKHVELVFEPFDLFSIPVKLVLV